MCGSIGRGDLMGDEQQTQTVVQASDAEEKLKKQRKVIILLLLLLLIGIAVVAYGFVHGWFTKEVEVPGGLVVDPSVGELEDPMAEANPDATSIAINGYPALSFQEGETNVYLGFENPAGNPGNMTFALVLDDGGETIYQSGAVPPGKAINNATLTRGLDAGTYDATIEVRCYHVETGGALNNANLDTKITVSEPEER